MKTTLKITFLLIFALIIGTAFTVEAVEKTKKYHESWSVRDVETLNIINKFGELKFKNEGGPEITIDVVVTVEAANENKANELLDRINVSFSKNGKTVKAETSIEDNFRSQRKFSINYVINVPSDKNLVVSNKYGNTFVNKLNANGNFDIQYGNITANELTATASGKMDILLAYGKGNIETAANLNLISKYSAVSLGTLNDLLLDSKYSSVSFDKGNVLQIESKYDNFNFGKVKSVIANTKYTNIKIGFLASALKIENGYGGIKVNEVGADFESVSINNSYGQISIGLGKLNYTVDANCEYCGISYPADLFKGNKIKDGKLTSINGQVGSGKGGNVVIKSRYGEIKLGE